MEFLYGETSAYDTRQTKDFYLRKLKLKKSEHDVSYAGARFFNKLPGDIKNLKGTKFFLKN